MLCYSLLWGPFNEGHSGVDNVLLKWVLHCFPTHLELYAQRKTTCRETSGKHITNTLRAHVLAQYLFDSRFWTHRNCAMRTIFFPCMGRQERELRSFTDAHSSVCSAYVKHPCTILVIGPFAPMSWRLKRNYADSSVAVVYEKKIRTISKYFFLFSQHQWIVFSRGKDR